VDQIIIGVVINMFVLASCSRSRCWRNPMNSPPPCVRGGSQAGRYPSSGDPVRPDGLRVRVADPGGGVGFGLFHTRWGLQAQSVNPQADTVGVNVYRYRYLNVLLGGAVAFGSARFTIGGGPSTRT
jgi:ABC-type uncharacterized transport system permease subunit